LARGPGLVPGVTVAVDPVAVDARPGGADPLGVAEPELAEVLA
jgi:hypothetical protein